jgi:metallo-beta-lactamase class B
MLVLLLARTGAVAQPLELLQAWNQPVAPIRIVRNVYYVGPNGVSSFLITTSAGHILIDSGFAQTVPLIQASIERLGFQFADVRILLSGHAHPDHVAGHAAVQRLTGATVVAMEEDAAALEQGVGVFPPEERHGMDWPPVSVGRRIHDGDTVTLGEVTLRGLLTPGHTQGCTTWTMSAVENGHSLQVCFVGSFSINEGVRLLGDPEYPNRAQAYQRTFEVLGSLQCDVFLTEHPESFNLEKKAARVGKARRNPFVDARGFRRAVAEGQGLFQRQLAVERRSQPSTQRER